VQTGTRPSGVTFTDNGNGTGTLSGTPATGTAASYPITFTATNGIGAPAVQNFTLTVSVASANACAGYGSGNESALKGSYALLIQGMNGSGSPLNPFAAAASFAADGTGKITAGEVDVNQSGSSGSQHLTVSATGSSYKLGSDNRGCMTLFFGGNNQVVFHFVVGGISAGIASKGRVIEFDDTDGTGGRGAGILRLQTASDFVSSHLKARYAFGLDGFDFTNGHVAVGGAFTTASGGTTITNGYLDVDDAGSLSGPITGGTGSISSISATTGRATAVFNAGAGATFNLAVYVVNANELFVVSTDTLSASTVLIAGRAIVTGSSFSNSSLNGKYILHLSSSGGGSASVSLGLLTLSGGTINGTLYQYQGGVASSNPLNAGTYNVNTTSGRVSITGAGNHNPVLYLPTPTDGISAFIIGTDGAGTFGIAEFQPTATYSTTSLSGNGGKFFTSTEDPSDNTIDTHVATVTVTPSTGAVTGSQDSSGPNSPFLQVGKAITGTFVINSDGTGNLGTGTVLLTNGTKIFFIDEGGGPASINVIEQ
jgi:Putative Ig domain